MKKSLLSALLLANALAFPAWATGSDTNRCMAHLEDMVEGDSLNLRKWACKLQDDADMATLVAFLEAHPQIHELNIVPADWESETPSIVRVSIKPLAAGNTLTTLHAFSIAPGDSADFAQNSTLKTLNLYGKASDKDLEAIAGSTSLQSLSYHAVKKNTVIDKAALALGKNTTLRTLCLEGAPITDPGMLALAGNTHLKSICLGGSDDVAFTLSRNENLREVTLDASDMSDAAVIAVAALPALETLRVDYARNAAIRSIAANSHLTELSIQRSTWEGEILGEEELLALGRMHTLKRLNLHSRMATEGSSALAELPALTELSLLIGSDDAPEDAFFTALGNHPAMKSFSIFYNGSGHIPVKNLAALARSTTLEALSILGGEVDDAGAQALAQNESLRALNLTAQRLTDKGAAALARIPLTSLNLDFNLQVGSQGAAALAENPHLRTLSLRTTGIRNEGVVALAKNASLSALHLSMNPGISDISAHALAESTTLKILSVKSTRITAEGLEALYNNPHFVSIVY